MLFTEYTSFKSKKRLFLADSRYKQNVINNLSKKKRVEKGCSTINASNNAVESAVNNPSVIPGKYTYLLILFLDSNDVYFKSMRTISKTMKAWDIRKTTSTLRLEA